MELDFLKGIKHFKSYLVTIVAGGTSYKRIVDGKSFSIGRSLDCTLALPEPNISRVHVIVSSKGDQIFVTDQDSSNGTFINDQRIEVKKPMPVIPTDVIRLGNTSIRIQLEVFERLFKDEIISQQNAPNAEKEALKELIDGANQQAQRLILLAQEHNEKLGKTAEEKIAKLEQDAQKNAEDLKANGEAQVAELIRIAVEKSKEIEEQAKRAGDAHIDSSKKRATEEVQKIYQEAEIQRQDATKLKEGAFQILDEANKNASEIERKAKAEGEQHILNAKNVAKVDVQKIYMEAEKYKIDEEFKIKKEIEEAAKVRAHAADVLKAATEESKEVVEEAKLKAEKLSLELIEKAKEATKQIYMDAEKHKIDQAFLVKKELDEATKVKDEVKAALVTAQKSAEEQEKQARATAENIINEAKAKAELDVKTIYTHAEALRKQSEVEIITRRQELEKELAQKRLDMERQARDVAQKLTDEAQKLAEKKAEEIRSTAKKQGEELKAQILVQARAEAVNHVSDLTAQIEAAKAELKELRKQKETDLDKEIDKRRKDLELSLNDSQKALDRIKEEREYELRKKKEELDLMVSKQALEISKIIEKKEVEIRKIVEESEFTITKQQNEIKHLKEVRDHELKKKDEELKFLYEKHVLEIDKITAQKEKEMIERAEIELKDKRRETNEKELKAKHLSEEIEKLQSQLSKYQEKFDKESKALEQVKKQKEVAEKEKLEFLEGAKTAEAAEKTARIREEQLEQRAAQLMLNIEASEKKISEVDKQYNQKLQKQKDELEKEFARLKQEKERQFQESFHLENEKAQKMTEGLLLEIQKKKDHITHDIHRRVLDLMSPHVTKEKYKDLAPVYLTEIEAVFDDNLAGISANAQTSTFNSEEINKRSKKERMRYVTSGLALGLVLSFSYYFVNQKIQQRTMASILEEQKKARDEELAARRFEPPQDSEVRDTYTDSVIYTKDFSKLYKDPEVQARWVKEARNYFFEKWRLPEETTIEVLSKAKTLVQSLDEKRANIHPDFVEQNIKKMKELEDETVVAMKDKLGTDVKFEAFKKFEKKFFMNEIAKREPAEVLVDPNLQEDKK